MEFMVKYGPHRRLDHYGAQLSFIQYYLIDVFGFLALVCASALSIALYALKLVVGRLSGIAIVIKKAKIQWMSVVVLEQ